MSSSPVTRPIASVVVPCFGQLEYTRRCIAALARHTPKSWQLVVVDNGSTDATAEYLRGVRDAAAFPVEVVANAENRGFPAACNQGLALAGGEYLVVLNNDAVVTDGWLEMLIALADSDPKIGMVGPMSNYAPPPQVVEDAPYADLEAMHRFADRWRAEHRGQWFTAPKLSGFCLLIKRAAFEAVGGFDESFGLGFFDDDDLALRMRHAGYELAVARDLFVHHYGSRTFAGAGVDAAALVQANRARYAAKWGEAAGPPLRPVVLSSWVAPAPRPAGRPKVSLTMIVRDEEHNLPACLGSARGLFDEIVVVDTGSTDRTVEVARSFGAIVSEFPWIDDFAAARNAALDRATGDYAFWLDADDIIEPAQRPRLRALLDSLDRSDPAGHVVRCACDASSDGSGQTIVDHVRLFPLRPEVRWTYRVHEQILPALRRSGVPVRWSDVVVRHTGYVDPTVRARKMVRDRAILEAELARDPEEPFVLFNLGGLAMERGEWASAPGPPPGEPATVGTDRLDRPQAARDDRPSPPIPRRAGRSPRRLRRGPGARPRRRRAALPAGRCCIATAATRSRPRPPGGGSSGCGGPSGSPASTAGSTATSRGGTWPPSPRSGATPARRPGSGARSSSNAPAIARPRRPAAVLPAC